MNKLFFFCLFFIFSCYADDLSVVHNVFEGGFTIDGYDLFFDEANKRDIKLGDHLYILSKEHEKVAGESIIATLLLKDPVTEEQIYFKSRLINSQPRTLIIEALKTGEGAYDVTLEDSAKYSLSNCEEVLPGDELELSGGLSPYVYAWRRENTWRKDGGDICCVLFGGGVCFNPLLEGTEKEVVLNLPEVATIFYGGVRVESPIVWNAKSWTPPFCVFPIARVYRENVSLSEKVTARGLARKMHYLYGPDTFHVRTSEKRLLRVGFASRIYAHVIEFFDFFPGNTFFLEHNDALQKVNSTLRFVERIDDQRFLFENSKGEKISATLKWTEHREMY